MGSQSVFSKISTFSDDASKHFDSMSSCELTVQPYPIIDYTNINRILNQKCDQELTVLKNPAFAMPVHQNSLF